MACHWSCASRNLRRNEPTHEIIVLFVLHKLILQTCMRSHPARLDDWFLVRPFVYIHTSGVRTAKALARLGGCTGSPKPSLVAYVISTIISWAGSLMLSDYIFTWKLFRMNQDLVKESDIYADTWHSEKSKAKHFGFLLFSTTVNFLTIRIPKNLL